MDFSIGSTQCNEHRRQHAYKYSCQLASDTMINSTTIHRQLAAPVTRKHGGVHVGMSCQHVWDSALQVGCPRAKLKSDDWKKPTMLTFSGDFRLLTENWRMRMIPHSNPALRPAHAWISLPSCQATWNPLSVPIHWINPAHGQQTCKALYECVLTAC
jgi:hypothetical protein